MADTTKPGNGHDEENPEIKVEDRRHWMRDDIDDDDSAPASTTPTIIDEYRERAEAAEARLQEYIAAFKQAESEQDAFRERMQRDVDRKVRLQFAGLVEELLSFVDDLDLAVSHASSDAATASLAEGVGLARDRLLGSLLQRGVERLTHDGETFDPNVAEAVQLEAVQDAERDGTVTATLRPGYRLGDHVVRPARVAVGKYVKA